MSWSTVQSAGDGSFLALIRSVFFIAGALVRETFFEEREKGAFSDYACRLPNQPQALFPLRSTWYRAELFPRSKEQTRPRRHRLIIPSNAGCTTSQGILSTPSWSVARLPYGCFASPRCLVGAAEPRSSRKRASVHPDVVPSRYPSPSPSPSTSASPPGISPTRSFLPQLHRHLHDWHRLSLRMLPDKGNSLS